MMYRQKSITAMLISALALLSAEPAYANPKKEFQAAVKSSVAGPRAAGEPKDRCSLGVLITDDLVVFDASNSSSLKFGDKILKSNGREWLGKTSLEFVTFLRETGPNEKVALEVERDGKIVSLEEQCQNAKSFFAPVFQAADFVSRGKFDECVTTPQLQEAWFKYGCAVYSKNPKKYDLPQLAYEMFKVRIARAHWTISERQSLINDLRANEKAMKTDGASSRYEELVNLTRKWPGGEKLYDATKPDWAQFRRNSEAVITAQLIDPSSAQFEWPHGFMYGTWKPLLSKRVQGYVTCGVVNARNRFGGYVGRRYFVVVLDHTGNVLYSEMGTERDFDLLSSQCAASASQFPPADLDVMANNPASKAESSLADQLQKLSDLKNTGALSEEEFKAAKDKLLSTPPTTF